MTNTDLTPFTIDIPQSDVDDLLRRLADTRWPTPTPGRDDRADFSRGMPLPYVRELADHWREGFDWREQEARLNEHPQVTTVVDGQTFHVVHVRSANPEATPLVLNHGWPGSFVEYQRLIPLLTDDFHVVVPSLPGFGFSTPLAETGWDLHRTIGAYAEIMARLGYERFGVHGTDLGTGTAAGLAALHPDRVVGVHLGVDTRWVGLAGDLFPFPDWLTEEETAAVEAVRAEDATDRGYLLMHSHRPDTIGVALTDSPVAQLAWIAEKFKTRPVTSPRMPHESVDRDQLLTDVSLFWFTCSGATSAQLYYESEHSALGVPMVSDVPTGWAVFGAHPVTRRVVDPMHAIEHWSEFADGGHFPAMEEPALLASDIRAFFTALD